MDDLPAKKPATVFPRDIEKLSVFELETYITDLKAEISRCEKDIASKKAQKAAADSLFG